MRDSPIGRVVAIFDEERTDAGEPVGMLVVGERSAPEESLELYPSVTFSRAREIALERGADFELA